MNSQKIIIFSTVFIDILGFGIVIPILPFYLNEFGASPTVITILFSVYSLCAFISSPFLGSLSDRIGRKPVILLSIFSTAIGWIVFATATTIPVLFIGRMIDGLAAGNFSTAQSFLIDLSRNEKERVKNLGYIGATFGIGFIFGPLFGGILSTVSHAFPFYVAGGLALINGISAAFLLQESNFHRNINPINFNPFLPLLRAVRIRKLRSLSSIWFLFALSFVIIQTIFALFTQYVFGFDSFSTSLLFTIMGVTILVNQVYLLNRFWMHRFTQNEVERMMLTFTVIGTIFGSTGEVSLFLLALPFLGTSQAVMRVVTTNRAVNIVSPDMKGEIIGTNVSIMTTAMVLGPLVAGRLFEADPSYPFLLSGLLAAAALGLSIRWHRDRPRESPSALEE